MPTYVSDPHRPQYHFLPPTGWLNDPNGLIEWGGRYHMFYQHNPNGGFHHHIHWGHTVSDDLVHWQHLPIALAPTPNGPDKDGCWSGCAVDHDGTPTLLYTGTHPQVQCLATSRDGLITWQKFPDNPIIAAPPPGLEIIGSPPEMRDPFVWREEGIWYMALGTGLRGEGGAVLLYRSQDLRHWEYLQPLHSGRFASSGALWECPNLFPLEGRHVLLISEQPEFKHTYYQLGRYVDHRFTPEITGKTDHSKFFYAALTLLDRGGRRLMWGWLKEGRSAEAQVRHGWSGVMALPRVLSVTSQGTLGMAPAPELAALRRDAYSARELLLEPGSQLELPLVGDALEFSLELELSPGATVTLAVRATPDGAEQTGISYDRNRELLSLDALGSSLNPEVEPERIEVAHQPGTHLKLRIFVDRSVIEVFADSDTCITSRVYPSRADSVGVRLSARSGSVRVVELAAWKMASIWPG